MGNGKSSVLKMLSKGTYHVPCYVDCTTKDLGDIMMPKFKTNESKTTYRSLRMKSLVYIKDKPIIMMLDEYGKGDDPVKMALTRLTLERTLSEPTRYPKIVLSLPRRTRLRRCW